MDTLSTPAGSLLTILLTHFNTCPPPSQVELSLLALITICISVVILQGTAWDRPDPHRRIYYHRPQVQHGQDLAVNQQSRDISLYIRNLEAHIVIFWGSQSGTAERLAQRLAKDLHVGFGLRVLTADLSDYDPSSLATMPASTVAIFLLSTYGEGEPSDNATDFWNWIFRDSLPKLNGLRYLAFGLGNSNYKNYNKVVDNVSARLGSLGAKCLAPVSRGDEATGTTEEDYLAWTEHVYKVLQIELGVSRTAIKYVPSVSVEALSTDLKKPDYYSAILSQRDQHRIAALSSTKCLPIWLTRHLTSSNHARPTLHMELDLTDVPEARYKTGDHLAVWPINPDCEVARLLEILGCSDTADDTISITSLNNLTKLDFASTTSTLRELLRHQIDICGPVSRNTALELAEFAPTFESRAVVFRLGNNRAEFERHVGRYFTTLSGLLSFCSNGVSWPGLPLSYLIESRPPLQPRYYSISSSSVLAPRRLSITVRIESSMLPTSKNENVVSVPGLASNYLLDISEMMTRQPLVHSQPLSVVGQSPRLCCQIRRTKFKLPVATTTPVIMIANGTGIAPFRAFIQERADQHAVGRTVGKMIFFFGCRGPGDDYLYENELKKAQQILSTKHDTLVHHTGTMGLSDHEEGLNSGLDIKIAFSRLFPEHKDQHFKGYVQDAVAGKLKTVISMLSGANASLYICGGANMARAVSATVARGYADMNQVDIEVASAWVSGFKRTGKWMEDVWD